MIVVTGGAGFIGSNLIKALNDRGREDIVIVDDLAAGRKCLNLNDCRFSDYLDKEEFRDALNSGSVARLEPSVVYHLGACSATTEWDGRYMLDNNHTYSKAVLEYCRECAIPLVYASSAAVYGAGREFAEDSSCERPLNAYGFSKCVFDQYARRHMANTESLLVGLRYFNVYGPREQHKGAMASVAWHFNRQCLETGIIKPFRGSHGYADGEQRRDFVYIADVVDVTLWFGEQKAAKSGIYNCGSGTATTFNVLAQAIIDAHGRGERAYIDFPEQLEAAYQAYTCADLSRLRASGCKVDFRSVEKGIQEYLRWLDSGSQHSSS